MLYIARRASHSLIASNKSHSYMQQAVTLHLHLRGWDWSVLCSHCTQYNVAFMTYYCLVEEKDDRRLFTRENARGSRVAPSNDFVEQPPQGTCHWNWSSISPVCRHK